MAGHSVLRLQRRGLGFLEIRDTGTIWDDASRAASCLGTIRDGMGRHRSGSFSASRSAAGGAEPRFSPVFKSLYRRMRWNNMGQLGTKTACTPLQPMFSRGCKDKPLIYIGACWLAGLAGSSPIEQSKSQREACARRKTGRGAGGRYRVHRNQGARPARLASGLTNQGLSLAPS